MGELYQFPARNAGFSEPDADKSDLDITASIIPIMMRHESIVGCHHVSKESCDAVVALLDTYPFSADKRGYLARLAFYQLTYGDSMQTVKDMFDRFMPACETS